MIRSMSAAVTGLRGHQQKLDVVGNNIANVNTIGFKKSQARFEDLLSQTIQGATGPFGDRGGINPSQVGLGMRVSSITEIHSQGAITTTDRVTDLAIEGEGFFIVTDGTMNYYTRNGSFGLDANGTLVNENGLKVLGIAGQELIIPVGDDMVAQATTEMVFAGNLDANIWNQGPAGRVTGSEVLTDVGFLGNATGGRVLTDALLQGMTGALTLGFNVDGTGAVNVTFTAAEMAAITTRQMLLDALNTGTFTDADGNVVDIADAIWAPTAPGNADGGLNNLATPADADFNDQNQLVITSQSAVFPSSIVLSGPDVADLFGTPVYTDGSTLADPAIDVDIDIVFSIDGGPDQSMSITAAEMGDITTQQMLLDAINTGQFVDAANNPVNVAGWAGLTGATASIVDNNLRVTSDSTDPNSRVEMTGPGVGILFGASPDFVDGVAEIYDYEYYVHDSLGRRYNVDFEFYPIDQNLWRYELTVTDDEGNVIPVNAGAAGTIAFTTDGEMDLVASNTPNIEFNPPGANPMVVAPDFNVATQLSGPNSLVAQRQDGHDAGSLAAFNIDRVGRVVGAYTNGMRVEFGQLALATFANPEGLRKEGGNLYLDTDNSGDPQIGAPGQGGRGLVQSSALELSNTDLAYEFTELITTSRGFQANTRVVTTSDEVLTEVVNMKR